jgi:hypothetical protein
MLDLFLKGELIYRPPSWAEHILLLIRGLADPAVHFGLSKNVASYNTTIVVPYSADPPDRAEFHVEWGAMIPIQSYLTLSTGVCMGTSASAMAMAF